MTFTFILRTKGFVPFPSHPQSCISFELVYTHTFNLKIFSFIFILFTESKLLVDLYIFLSFNWE